MYKRLFIAIKIDPTEELLRRIHFLKLNLTHEQFINWIPTNHYHLTLKFLGKVHQDRIGEISERIRGVLEEKEKFLMQLTNIGIFGSNYSPGVLWGGVDENKRIRILYQGISKVLSNIGFSEDGQNFVPHISIARIKKITDKKFFQELIKKADLISCNQQKVNEIILYESILKSTGADYRVVEKFDLV